MTTLETIRTKIRRVTARPSPNQLSDVDLDDYINTFYLYDLPEHLRLINLKETYSFIAQPDIDLYNFTPNVNVSIQPPVYVSGNEIRFYQSKQEFFTIYPEIMRNDILTNGNGGPGPYGGTIIGIPVKRGNNRVLLSTVDINGNALSAQDDGAGSFTGDVAAGGTINYITGVIGAINWTANIAAGEPIRVQSVFYQRARPQGILFFNDTFQLSPVPDQAYEIKMDTYVTPTALLNSSDEPQLREWWQLIAYGASLKIFADNVDMENYGKINVLFDLQKRLIERRTLQQLKLSRVSTIYTDDFNYVTPFRSNQ